MYKIWVQVFGGLFRNNKPFKIFSKYSNFRSQDLPKLFVPTGAIWIAKVSQLLKHKNFYKKLIKFYKLNWYSGIDIDTHDDLKMLKNLKNNFFK